MKEGEKPVGSGTIHKLFGLTRGNLTDLEELDGLDYVGKADGRHRWFPSEVMEAKARREQRRQREAEERRKLAGWDNGCKDAFLAGCHVELAETRVRIIKEQDARIKKRSDQVVRDIEAEKQQGPVKQDDYRGKFKALLRA